MRSIGLFLLGFALLIAGIAVPHEGPTNTEISTVAYSSVYPPPIPGIQCAKEGPAKQYPSAGKTKNRKCWWGQEFLYSKNDSHAILRGATDLVQTGGSVALLYLQPEIAIPLIVGQGLGMGDSAKDAAHKKIDNGTCLKVTMIVHILPAPGTYHCT